MNLDSELTFDQLGTAGGVFLLLVGLATLVAMPWATNNSIAISLGQVVGILGTLAIGAGLIWLARQE